MKPPTNPPTPPSPGTPGDKDERPDAASARRPGGHGSYKLGGEPAVGHRWDEAPAPPPATMTRFDDGVPHRPHPPGDIDPLHNEDVDHEHSDVNIRALVGAAVIMAVVVAVSQLLMWGMFQVMEMQAKDNDPIVPPVARPGATMPTNTQSSPFFNDSVGGPRLMVNEPANLANQREGEQKRLHSSGWVNQAAGVAHISIDQAKKLIRERLPVREGVAVAPTVGTRAPSRGEASGGRMMVIEGAPASAAPDTHSPAGAPAPGEAHPPAAAPAHPQAPATEAPAAKPHGPGGH